MADVEQVSSLIGDIHDAALNPALWPTALALARRFVGGSAAALFSTGTAADRQSVACDDGGLDPHYKRLLFERYARLHPCASGWASAKSDEPIAAADLVGTLEFRSTRFHREWAQPQGLADFLCVALDKAAGAMFYVFRHERDGPVDEAARGRLRLIAPHIRRAVSINRSIDRDTAKAASLADTLDGLRAGLLLIDAAGRVVHANASARALLRDRSVLCAAGGKLAANEAKAAQALSEIFAVAGSGKTACRIATVLLTARDGERYVAHVLPLGARARGCADAGQAAVAALFVRKVGIETPAPEALARTFSLTPGELRVLFAIVEVGGVPETAEALGLAETTVKTHLHRLFGKTGAVRQADLVKLVAGFSNPVVARPAPAVRNQPIGGRIPVPASVCPG